MAKIEHCHRRVCLDMRCELRDLKKLDCTQRNYIIDLCNEIEDLNKIINDRSLSSVLKRWWHAK
jgi:hypothetical protein